MASYRPLKLSLNLAWYPVRRKLLFAMAWESVRTDAGLRSEVRSATGEVVAAR